jgi:nucleotide-binding universal stress UspA family protein
MPALTPQPIICGTDFSVFAQKAANVASALAKQLGTRLVLVHGIDERGEIPQQYWTNLRAMDRPALDAEAARLRQAGIEVQEELVGGVPDDGVAKCAERLDARMIVVGFAGKSTVERWVLGSAAERIAETAPVPTLVVHDAAALLAWVNGERSLRVFVAADFTSVSDAALRWVAEFRKIAACEITLGFVDRSSDERAELAVFDALNLASETPEAREENKHDLCAKAERWLGVQPAMVCVAPGSARIDEHVLQLASAARADLIVVGTHQWHGVSRLRHASVSRQVLRDGRTNVACIPLPASPGINGHLPDVRRVLVATDFSQHHDRAISHAYGILSSGGTISLLHVTKPGEQRAPIMERLQKLIPSEANLRRIRTELQTIENNDTATAIRDAADRFDADVICVGSHGHSRLVASALGSVAHELISKSSRPVLVVRPLCS